MWEVLHHHDRTLIEGLLDQADIEIDGPDPWDVQIHDERVYRRVLSEGSLGLGEAYMDGWWHCEQLDEFFFRAFRARLPDKLPASLHTLAVPLVPRLVNPQTRVRSKVVVRLHYDLGNEFFQAMLDPYTQYSCGHFRETDDLAAAQREKLELICRNLQLKSSDRLLDIGCGWGGLARYAAEQFGCEVVGINISDEQIRFARELCAGQAVKVVKADYRDMKGEFDKIVSVGMFEHVGYKNYRTFLEDVQRLLKPDGLLLLRCIGESSIPAAETWVNHYIFPNSELPSQGQIAEASAPLFVMEDWRNFSADYDKTLMAWHSNFERNWPKFAATYGRRFYRMWTYYLLSCAGKFRSRGIQLWHIVFSPAGVLGGYSSVC